jgi:hypothetical protein
MRPSNPSLPKRNRSLVTPPVKFRILKIHAPETRPGKRPPRWEAPDFPRQRPAHCPLTLGNVGGSPTPGTHTAETGLAGWAYRIRTSVCREKIHLFEHSSRSGFARVQADRPLVPENYFLVSHRSSNPLTGADRIRTAARHPKFLDSGFAEQHRRNNCIAGLP